MDVEAKPETLSKAFRAETIFWAVMLFLGAALIVSTGSSKGIAVLIVTGIWGCILLRKRRSAESWQENTKRIIIFILICALMQLTSPLHVSRYGKWRYPIVRKYLEFYHAAVMPSYIPDKIPDGAEDYMIGYVPTILQGNGHFTLHYRGDLSDIEESLMQRDSFMMSIPLLEYIKADGSYKLPGYDSSDAYNDGTLYVYYDREFWAGHEQDAKILVISGSFNSHRPHSNCILIDRDSDMIEFSYS